MKIVLKETTTVCGSTDEIKTKKCGTIAGIFEAVKLFFVGDGGKPIDLDLTPELKALMLIF